MAVEINVDVGYECEKLSNFMQIFIQIKYPKSHIYLIYFQYNSNNIILVYYVQSIVDFVKRSKLYFVKNHNM